MSEKEVLEYLSSALRAPLSPPAFPARHVEHVREPRRQPVRVLARCRAERRVARAAAKVHPAERPRLDPEGVVAAVDGSGGALGQGLRTRHSIDTKSRRSLVAVVGIFAKGAMNGTPTQRCSVMIL
jgi:hypothetical protein